MVTNKFGITEGTLLELIDDITALQFAHEDCYAADHRKNTFIIIAQKQIAIV